jgi:hypothetical protein
MCVQACALQNIAKEGDAALLCECLYNYGDCIVDAAAALVSACQYFAIWL